MNPSLTVLRYFSIRAADPYIVMLESPQLYFGVSSHAISVSYVPYNLLCATQMCMIHLFMFL